MTDGIDKDWFALNPAKYTEKELVAVIEILHSFNVPVYEADNRETGLTEAHGDIRDVTGEAEELLEEHNPQVKIVRRGYYDIRLTLHPKQGDQQGD